VLVNEKVRIYHNTVIKKTSSNNNQNLLYLSFDIELQYIFLSVTLAGKSPYEIFIYIYSLGRWHRFHDRFIIIIMSDESRNGDGDLQRLLPQDVSTNDTGTQ